MVEVVVVGGGIAGVATALALVERGAAVNLVEAGRPASAATGASAGMLAPQYESPGPGPLYRFGIRSRGLWPAFARRLSELSGRRLAIRWDGMLVANLSGAEEDEARAAIRWQTGAGQRAELLSPTDAAGLQPGLSPDVRSWLWLPDEGQVDAQQLVDVFDAALRAAEARYIPDTRVEALRVEAGEVSGVVLADGRTLSADRVVLAAGAWTPEIGGVPRELSVRPVRGQMLRFPSGPALDRLVANHHGRYIVPRDDGSILAGSTMEEAGFDRSITEEGRDAILATCRGLVPGLEGPEPSEHWADFRPLTPDSHPILGADPDLEGLFYATGHGRNGILLGPVTGEVVADLVLEGAPVEGPGTAEELAAFAPDRFE
jgi:glycine oxidase